MNKKVVHVCTGGPIYYIMVNGRKRAFEMHPYCGLMPVNVKTLEGLKTDPGTAFWAAVDLWVAGGSKVADDGVTCVLE